MGGGEELIIQLVVMLVMGGITAAIANSKGRNALGWFAIGFFFGCIGLIIILCLSNVNEENARWAAQNVEQTRLREQLRQEQLKNEALRQHTVARLDQHDQALNMDTKETAPALTNMQPEPRKLEFSNGNEPPAPPEYAGKSWFLNNDGQQEGPFTWELMYRRAKQGTLSGETLVWAEGMEDWKPANEIPIWFS